MASTPRAISAAAISVMKSIIHQTAHPPILMHGCCSDFSRGCPQCSPFPPFRRRARPCSAPPGPLAIECICPALPRIAESLGGPMAGAQLTISAYFIGPMAWRRWSTRRLGGRHVRPQAAADRRTLHCSCLGLRRCALAPVSIVTGLIPPAYPPGRWWGLRPC